MEGMTKKKGKEGTRGAKQIARENLDTIAFYRKMAVASTLVYLAGMVALGATFTYTDTFLTERKLCEAKIRGG